MCLALFGDFDFDLGQASNQCRNDFHSRVMGQPLRRAANKSQKALHSDCTHAHEVRRNFFQKLNPFLD